MSLQQYYGGKTLVRRGKVSVVNVTERYIFFIVESKGADYSVIFERARARWGCNCFYKSTYGVNKVCKHVKACQFLVGGRYGK